MHLQRKDVCNPGGANLWVAVPAQKEIKSCGQFYSGNFVLFNDFCSGRNITCRPNLTSWQQGKKELFISVYDFCCWPQGVFGRTLLHFLGLEHVLRHIRCTYHDTASFGDCKWCFTCTNWPEEGTNNVWYFFYRKSIYCCLVPGRRQREERRREPIRGILYLNF